jgi:hypothetical protein
MLHENTHENKAMEEQADRMNEQKLTVHCPGCKEAKDDIVRTIRVAIGSSDCRWEKLRTPNLLQRI